MDKRRGDLAKMDAEWARWQRGVGPILPALAADQDVRALAPRLRSLAEQLEQQLQTARAAHGSCVLHGDFKAANLFFRVADDLPHQAGGGGNPESAASVAACDFQWAGYGLGVQDVAYLLWTSVHEDVMPARERGFVAAYHAALECELRRSGRGAAPPLELLWAHYEVRAPRPAQVLRMQRNRVR